MATYIAYPYKKGNQSFIMKDENNQSVYEANLVKFNLLGACDYEFVDVKSNHSEIRKVGKTITKQQGFGNVSFTTASYFNLDGTDIFKIFDDKGYHFKMKIKLDLFHPVFALLDSSNNEVATFKLNVTGERQEEVFAIGNKQKNTVIETECEDIELLFLAAFTLNRVDLSAGVL